MLGRQNLDPVAGAAGQVLGSSRWHPICEEFLDDDRCQFGFTPVLMMIASFRKLRTTLLIEIRDDY